MKLRFIVSLSISLLIVPYLVWAFTSTPYAMDFYGYATLDGAPIPVGAVVTAYDPQGVECGSYTVDVEGQYGFLHVYGDDPSTPEDEGAVSGDTITFKINGYDAVATGDTSWIDKGQEEVDLSSISSLDNAISPIKSKGSEPEKIQIVVIANSIDYSLAKNFFIFLENQNLELIHSTALDYNLYKTEKFIIILGGPDAYDGIGNIVQGIITPQEQKYLRSEGKRETYVKNDVWAPGQVLFIVAGSDRYQTQKAHEVSRGDLYRNISIGG